MDSDRDEERCWIVIAMAMDCDSPGDRSAYFFKPAVDIPRGQSGSHNGPERHWGSSVRWFARDKILQAQYNAEQNYESMLSS